MENEQTKARKWLSRCLISLLAATLAVNLISALIRLDEAGLGCEPWPHCYAQVGRYLHGEPPSAADAVAPVEAVKRAHRTLATVLVVLVLVMVAQARQLSLQRFARGLPYAIAFVVLLLAVVGPASYLKTLPAIATLNLTGGMLLLALSWLLWLKVSKEPPAGVPSLRRPAWTALMVLIVQLLLGAWVSANFAAAACTGVFDCEMGGAGPQSFWYLRELSLDGTGRIVQDGAQGLIQWLHHLWSMVTAVVLTFLGWCTWRTGGRTRIWGPVVVCLLGLQLLLGLSALTLSVPLWIVMLHNLVASLLLLAVLRLVMLSVDTSVADGAPVRF